MKLRKLEEKDAELMFEWMHDSSVVEHLQADFANKTIEDCKAFIKDANNDNDNTTNLHMAVINDQNEYMGTVSLKNITKDDAEFAITIRKIAMGQGYSQYAMKEIIRIGFEELKLNRIYWCVNQNNRRAIRFYDKSGYMRTDIKNDKYILNGGGLLTGTDSRIYLVPDIKNGRKNCQQLNIFSNIFLLINTRRFAR